MEWGSWQIVHFEGNNCLNGVLMAFEWLGPAELKVMYGKDISAGFGPFV